MTNRGHHLRSLTVCACCRCGFSPDELRAAGFNAAELKAHLNVSAKELKEGGYSKSRFPFWNNLRSCRAKRTR